MSGRKLKDDDELKRWMCSAVSCRVMCCSVQDSCPTTLSADDDVKPTTTSTTQRLDRCDEEDLWRTTTTSNSAASTCDHLDCLTCQGLLCCPLARVTCASHLAVYYKLFRQRLKPFCRGVNPRNSNY